MAGLLAPGSAVDLPTLAAELVGYLVGPAIPTWDLRDLDADVTLVRDCILARLILGDPPAGSDSLARLADVALLDHAVLVEQVRRPIATFWEAVDAD